MKQADGKNIYWHISNPSKKNEASGQQHRYSKRHSYI
jgi:hypothetical protein